MELFIPGPVGRLEAIAWPANDAKGHGVEARAAAIVCHPHPRGGGTMHNNVAFRLARGLQRAGVAVLRFNFRGVEQSAGLHDGNGAEEEDARAALDWLSARHPELELWASGFSFGARTVCSLATRESRIRRLVLVALPVKAFDCSAIARVRQPTHVVMAGNDSFGTLADVRGLFPGLADHVEFEEVPGVDHFFRGKTPELEARVRAFANHAMEPTQ